MQGELQDVKQQLSSSAAEVERLTGDLAEARSEARGLTAQVASLTQKVRTATRQWRLSRDTLYEGWAWIAPVSYPIEWRAHLVFLILWVVILHKVHIL